MPASTDQKTKHLYQFGPFQVDPERQLLLRGDETVPLTPKTFQILLVLVRHSKEIVTKEDILKTVWPDTFVEETNLTRNIFLLRKALGETPQDHQYVVTVPGRGYRFAENVELVPERPLQIIAASHTKVQVEVRETRNWRWLALAAVLFAAVAATVGFRLFFHRQPVLTEKDTVVLADFANSTGDPVFDGTLRQGMAVQLEQSPFLSLISDARIHQTLRLMGQPADARLTPGIAYEVCQRTQSAALVEGSIANLGREYVFGLKAVSCHNGDLLIEEQERATGKEQILEALDRAAVKLRQRLGESYNSLERFHTPLEQATTPSFEALQAYSLGRLNMVGKAEFEAAIPFFQRAIRLDPNFAMAYAALGSDYWSLGETSLAAENVRKAYELRSGVSEPENFYIESTYYHVATGDLEKARQVYELSAQTYPRYAGTPLRLWVLYKELGRYDDALAQILQAIRLDSSRAVNYSDLVYTYIELNRFEEAEAKAKEVEAKQLDSSPLRHDLFALSFLNNDARGMNEQIEWAKGNAGTEDSFLIQEADAVAYSGQLKRSRDLSRRAMALSLQAGRKNVAINYQVRASLREALFGNAKEAREEANAALRSSPSKDPQFGAALALAFIGETARAQVLADDLAKRFPDDTIVHFNRLPVLYAQLALNRVQSSKAIEELRQAIPYELGSSGSNAFSPALYPVYVRGNAYLAAHQGAAAAGEFQRIIDHSGIVRSDPIGALAHLQLGRAYELSGNKTKARSAYQDFLSLWKNADPDIPILRQAKAEYSKLQ